MDTDSHEPKAPAASLAEIPATRHDGWSGEKMAKFCETLAETAIVAEACDEVGMHISGAYALRRRNPVFAAGWDAALTIARERLADTLLARSIEGNAELFYRNGELVGRRDVIDNRLGLAILGRLDRLAETGRATALRRDPVTPAVTSARIPGPHAPAIVPACFDWQHMVDALRSGEPDDVASALAILKSYEVEEVEDPPISPDQGDSEDEGIDLSDRCWFGENEGAWMTDFPPPAGFDGEEEGEWHEFGYQRTCSAKEAALMDAQEARFLAEELAAEEDLRDRWFALLSGQA
jgi:hypothetical protein